MRGPKKNQVILEHSRHVSFDYLCRKASEELGRTGKGWVKLVAFLDTGNEQGTISYCFEADSGDAD